MYEEPFVILWRAQTSTDPRVARTCFERVRVHHPNALVCIFRDGNADLSYVDERCYMARDVCVDDVSAWRYFVMQEAADRWGAGLLLHDNIFVGSRPFPAFLQNQFLWLENPDRPDASFRLEPSGEIVSFPKPLGLLGYFRKSFFQNGHVPSDPNMFVLDAVRRGVGFTFRRDPCELKHCLDALVQADVPVYCRIG